MNPVASSLAVDRDEPLALAAPPAVAALAPERAQATVKLDADALIKLETQIEQFVAAVERCVPGDGEFRQLLNSIARMGEDEAAQGSGLSRRVLSRPAAAVRSGALSAESLLSNALAKLRGNIASLDPAAAGDLLAPRKLFGLIPWGNRLDAYFERYQAAQAQLQGCMAALLRGREELERENAALDEEALQMRGLLLRLEQYVYLLTRVDARVESLAQALHESEPDKARMLKDDLLFELRQKHSDLLTQTVVNAQGYLALEMIRKTNLELIKGVQRATSTTVAALRVAVLVSQTLGRQAIALDQIRALNADSGRAVAAGAAALQSLASTVGQRTVDANTQLDSLKSAFRNVYASMDSIDAFRIEALGSMMQTADLLGADRMGVDIQRSEVPIGQAQNGRQISASTDSDSPINEV